MFTVKTRNEDLKMALSDENTGREHADRDISTDKLTLKYFDLQGTPKYSLNVYP